MKEVLFGFARMGEHADEVAARMQRHSQACGLVVRSQARLDVVQMYWLADASQEGTALGPERIHIGHQRLLGWAGHVVTEPLPLWPDASELGAFLGPAPLPQLAPLDGLFAIAVHDAPTRRLILAADPLGMHPLLIARWGGGWLFSNSADLLLRSFPGRITLNETAAAEYLHFHHCLGDKTLANEVERVPLGRAMVLQLDDGRERSERLWDLSELPVPEPVAPHQAPDDAVTPQTVEALACALEHAVARRLRHKHDNLCLLSGGWDSRALCALLAERGLRVPTLTTYGDTGTMDDPDGARLVAEDLGLTNTYLPLPPDYLARHWRDKCLATDFATTMHTWLWPLTTGHPYGGAVNHDGIAGDVALKGLLLKPEHLLMLRERRNEELVAALWRHHAASDALTTLLRPEVAEQWAQRARQSLADAVTLWQQHPNALSFFVLTHRTRRAIAASPTQLLELRLRNVAPFLDRGFLRIAMAIAPDSKMTGQLYRRVLSSIKPGLELIPSSNDKDWPASLPRRRRPSTATTAWFSYANEIAEQHRALAPWCLASAGSDDGPTGGAHGAPSLAVLRRTQGLGDLALWMKEYLA
jgi:hypothetical protein